MVRHPGLFECGPDQPDLEEVLQSLGKRRLLCHHGRERRLIDDYGGNQENLRRPVVVVQETEVPHEGLVSQEMLPTQSDNDGLRVTVVPVPEGEVVEVGGDTHRDEVGGARGHPADGASEDQKLVHSGGSVGN